MTSRDDAKRLQPLRRTARQAGVPTKWLKEQAELGNVPGLRAGTRWLFMPEAVVQAIQKMAQSTSPQSSNGGESC